MDAITIFWLIIISLGVLVLVREILCWYWKINEITNRLESLEITINNQGDTLNQTLSELCKMVKLGIETDPTDMQNNE